MAGMQARGPQKSADGPCALPRRIWHSRIDPGPTMSTHPRPPSTGLQCSTTISPTTTAEQLRLKARPTGARRAHPSLARRPFRRSPKAFLMVRDTSRDAVYPPFFCLPTSQRGGFWQSRWMDRKRVNGLAWPGQIPRQIPRRYPISISISISISHPTQNSSSLSHPIP